MIKCGISAVINSFPRSSSSRSVPFPPTVGKEGSLWSVCARFPWHTVHLWVWDGKSAGHLHQHAVEIPSQCLSITNPSSQALFTALKPWWDTLSLLIWYAEGKSCTTTTHLSPMYYNYKTMLTKCCGTIKIIIIITIINNYQTTTYQGCS